MSKVKHKKLIITLSVVGGFIIAVLAAFFIYVGIYYHADGEAETAAATQSEYYSVSTLKGGDIAFIPENPETGLIFYPGGKVEYTAYAPLMTEFAKKGVLCVLVKMPFNLAVFDSNAATKIKDCYPNISNWYVGGHSLGGSMAAAHAAKHSSDYDGLLLLAAYSTKDISNLGLNVISVYGSNDGVLKMSKYNKYKSNLPTDYSELVIDGGCHAYFGNYGAQKGDGTPTVTRKEQQLATVDFALSVMAGE